ncbi:MAG TPA: glycosyltransferase family 4 protein [Candidatus Acidoferrales bacterium]|nr:glycosyltransferase family 4 protein [Candidatus Acidoferrales bacterium]
MIRESEGASVMAAPAAPPTSETASEKKTRVLLLCSHPTQYGSPMWRRLSQHPRLEVLVAYCSMQGAEAHMDPDFGVKVAWDVPLLDGYPWIQLKNVSLRPKVGGVFGLINPGIWKVIRSEHFDAIAIFTGYMCATFWIALAAAKLSGIPVMYGTDATTLRPIDGRGWKTPVKKYLWPRLFQMADMVIAPSSGTASLMRSLNVRKEKITLMPYVVDNDWWVENASRVDRKSVRKAWGIREDARVILFCAKLQPWKRPQDLLRAFSRANLPNAYLVYAGDGSLRGQLEREANKLGVSERVRFLGFVNQSALPQVYCSSDVMVLPSEYEAFGVVVNEAMLCGCPVIVSDRVGARFDLVQDGVTGYVYPCGDIARLAHCLQQILSNPALLPEQRDAARARITRWSPELYVQRFVRAACYAKSVHRTRE